MDNIHINTDTPAAGDAGATPVDACHKKVREAQSGTFKVIASAWLNADTGLWQPRFCIRRAGDIADHFPWFLYRGFSSAEKALDAAVVEGMLIAEYWQTRTLTSGD